jgi:hypothetical protein
MNKIISIEPAIDPTNRPTFLLDWELTMKCNLDCDYCSTGIEYGGHDNSTSHPPKDECLKTIDFMFAYADKYMQLKPKWQRMVVLNVYGGESIFHPDIVEILEQVRARHKYDWPLTVTCTSNAVAGKTLWEKVANLIDEFTVSFHSSALPKQRQQVLDNILYNKAIGRRQKVVFVMHNNPALWDISQQAIEFCKTHDVRYVVKANDTPTPQWQYNKEQFIYFQDYYKSRTPAKSRDTLTQALGAVNTETVGMGKIGRGCCGGRQLCTNQDLKHPTAFVPHADFMGWSCSVNWYFLYIKQINGDVYTNKDCRMRFDGSIGPIGNLASSNLMLEEVQKNIDNKAMPVIQCARTRCICGYCAPKAQDPKDFEAIMDKHLLDKEVKFVYNSSLEDK